MRRLKILFVIREIENYFYLKSIIEALLRRSHQIKILFDKDASQRPLGYINEYKSHDVTFGWAPKSKKGIVGKILLISRGLLGLRRYYNVKGQSKFYKQRWRSNLPSPLVKILSNFFVEKLLVSNLVAPPFFFFEKYLPQDQEIRKEILSFDPDVVMASPANVGFSADIDYLRCAKKLKIPTAVCVMTWDNLTTKGIFYTKPDLLLVWNRQQILEAKRHHDVDSKRIKVVGATFFDFWFEGFGKKIDKLFGQKLGLGAPYILYLCSSGSIVPDELWLIKKIREALNKSKYPELAKWQLLVRPHPRGTTEFQRLNEPGIIVYPRNSFYPVRRSLARDYFSSVYFSEAIVGINTSGMIDGLLADKAVIAYLTDRFRYTQAQAAHFKILAKSGALRLVHNVDGLVKTLHNLPNEKFKFELRRKNFIETYIRPRGVSQSAGEGVALAIEELADG